MRWTATSHSGRWSTWILQSSVAILSFATLLPTAMGAKTAADYYVSSLPGAPQPLLRMFAGHIEITPEHHGNMFFWLFKNKHIAERQRTVIWLNGGPGCSSMDGALMEVGPYRVNEDGTLRLSDGSWDEFANIVFVDNPVGTGFSYVDGDSYLHELKEMSSQMVTFLDKFFEIFPEHAKDDLYIAGESYAGQHIPYVAKAMLERNEAHQGQEWNVSGLLIGNGWFSGPEQYPSYISYAYESGLLKPGSEAEKAVLKQQEQCVKDLKDGGKDHVDTSSCEQILQEILLRIKTGKDDCINMYDVRLKDSYPSCGMNWPPDLKWMTPYLRRDDVTRALHINKDKKTGWQECNNQISSTFKAYKSEPSVKLLPGLLEKLPIVIFAGEKDMICNYIGIEDMISKLEFNGGTGFETSPGTWAPRLDWTFEDEPAGFYQSARNLTYIRFYNSSHMVPFDYPRRTRDMLDRALGVDIASIGGTPADSLVGGEKGLETSVGGHPNSSAAMEAEKEKVSEATWAAYRRSGEVALVVVIIAASAWFYFIWRDRRKRAGYSSLFGSDPNGSSSQIRLSTGLGLDGSSSQTRSKWREQRDVEAARDFDEAELDDLTSQGQKRDLEGSRFGLASDDEDEDDHGRTGANGHA